MLPTVVSAFIILGRIPILKMVIKMREIAGEQGK
jgi:hypothetical protein